MNKYLLGAAALAFSAPAASASITVDGQIDAGYGAASATVATDPNAPDSNFQAPENRALAGYDIYLSSDASNVYGLVDLTGGNSAGNFANLYFDLNPTVGDGSDLGFEIGQNGVTAFIPGKNGQPGFNTVLGASNYAVALVPGGGLEFSLAKSLFTSPIAGLAYYDGQTFEGTITLRLSQSLSYSVAGGASYGPNRLGAIQLAAVPEPASWALMISGFAIAGAAARRRSHSTMAFA
ncbi:PEPxxWA-CTERM sorting domain-containing protein [Sphingomonas sp. ID1715]|uniref:PEPxxWA-CTERM sorting domain-containing protein n=1 Tax=Sphingomonas sp. ID1715 TaxID=1656898 RepID=UPI001487D022|nr:PEPxxWA-CTERM sorting domain-containing protein [Sphingomonas sp. ID1715]NNM76731.1 PEPxxWA-CTERM sorting domain-containing protein [Sphingomonas sp. ID1715]